MLIRVTIAGMFLHLVTCLIVAADPPPPVPHLEAPTATVAILPVDGDAVLPATKNAIDTALRRAAARQLGARLQTRADTDAVIADAVGAGLNCSLAEMPCSVRVGLIAGVGEVLVPIIRTAAAGPPALSLLRVDVTRAAAVVVAATPVDVAAPESMVAWFAGVMAPPASLSISVDGAVDAAMHGAVVVVDGVVIGPIPLPAPVAISTGQHIVRLQDTAGTTIHEQGLDVVAGLQAVSLRVGPPPGPVVATGPPFPAGFNAPLVGAVTAGVAGAVALVAGGATVALELGLHTPEAGAATYDERRGFGLVALGVTAVGLVGVVVGAGLAVFGGGS